MDNEIERLKEVISRLNRSQTEELNHWVHEFFMVRRKLESVSKDNRIEESLREEIIEFLGTIYG